MTGSGRPFAMQTRVTLLPSFTVMSEEILEIFGGTVKTKESWTLLLLEDSWSDLLTCLLINQRQPQTPLTGCAPHYYLVFWTVSVLQVQGPGFSVDKKINSSATTFWWCRHVKKKEWRKIQGAAVWFQEYAWGEAARRGKGKMKQRCRQGRSWARKHWKSRAFGLWESSQHRLGRAPDTAPPESPTAMGNQHNSHQKSHNEETKTASPGKPPAPDFL